MLSEQITIIIPSKNEEGYISRLLHCLVDQYDIKGTTILVADSSTDKTPEIVKEFKERYSDLVDIHLVKGGKVSQARNSGADLAKTPYLLFLDADIRFESNFHIFEAYLKAKALKLRKDKALVTSKLGSYAENWKCALAYDFYNIVHKVLVKKFPFAIGAFFMVDKQSFERFNKFNELVDNSEDFLFSQNFKPDEFTIIPHRILMDDRRFKKIGYLGFAKHLIVNMFMYLIGNKKHFHKDVGYWG